MFAVISCIRDEHDLGLVLVAAMICMVASCAAFGFHKQSLKAQQGMRASWLFLAALVAGSGVWATHFIAMLAYQPSLRVAYEPIGTAASLALAILGMCAAFTLAVRRPQAPVEAGLVAGISVAGMHFLGIAALRAEATVTLHPMAVASSILIASLGAVAAFAAVRLMKGGRGWLAGSALFVLAVCGLHFTAMTAVDLQPDPTIILSSATIGRPILALATTALAMMILAAAVALIVMERFTQRSTLTSVQAALDAVPSGLVFYDPEGRLLNWNRAMAGFMSEIGVTPERGLSRAVILAAAKRTGWFDTVEDASRAEFAEHRPWTNRTSEFREPDGRWIRREDFPTADGGGVTVMTDITEHRLNTQAMADARDAAEAASRAKSAFLANMSHEIRTPLNGVLGIADVLNHTDLSPKQAELVGVIQSSGALLNALLTDLLDLARVEAGVEALHPEPADLDHLIGSVTALLAGRAEQKGLTIRAEFDPAGAGWVCCDQRRLRQVLGNLMNNAVKFTEAGEVVISVARHGDAVRFAVTDTGQGFDDAMKAQLFGRFQQADDTSTRRHGGAGLGLTICQEYVALMGGSLDCTSRPGAGSTFEFTLRLPAIAAPVVVIPACDPAQTADGGAFRVLIVDDNAVNRQILGLILDSAGIAHMAVEDGAQALEAVMTTGCDAVLMDLQMPVMDGLEATRRIRAWEQQNGLPRTPVYIVSANCLQEHVDAGMSAGADGHLAKPVSVADLLGALSGHLPAALAA